MGKNLKPIDPTVLQQHNDLITALGGKAKVSDLLGFNPSNGQERIQHWTKKGIPNTFYNNLQHILATGHPIEEKSLFAGRVPACADSDKEYGEWKILARVSPPPSQLGFCADCTCLYQARMIKAGRCENPHIDVSNQDD